MTPRITNQSYMGTLPFTKKHQKVSSDNKITGTAQATSPTGESTPRLQPNPLPDFEGMDLVDLLLAKEPRVEGFSVPGRDDLHDESEKPQP